MLDTLINRGAEPARWLLVAGIAYTLAATVWSFVAVPATTTPAVQPEQVPNVVERAPVNVNWIIAKNLFGKAGQAASTQSRRQPAVQTRLPLELQSVFVADYADDSAAIVAQRGKPGKLYRVGEQLPGSATLAEVHTDHIILRRAGTRETLMFPQRKSKIAQPTETAREPVDRSPGEPSQARRADPAPVGEAGEVISEFQQKLSSDPDGTLDELGIESVDGGGYRLGGATSSEYLRKTGLQPGDIIMSVNGQPVGDVEQDRLELADVLAQGSARIEVVRGSRRFFITVSLN